MTDPALSTILENYKETVGVIAAVSFMGGFGMGWRLGTAATQKQIDPLKEQIDLMKRMLEENHTASRKISESHKEDIKQIQHDLRIAIKGACPIINE